MNEGKIRKGSNLNNTKVLEKTSVCWLETSYIYYSTIKATPPAPAHIYLPIFFYHKEGQRIG